MQDQNDIAAMFKALGEPTRLRIFEFLRDCCCPVAVEESGDVRPVTGPTVGEICCHVTGEERVTSNISFHLKEMRQAGLIKMERRGKYMVCGLNRDAAADLAAYLALPGGEPGAVSCCDDGCEPECCPPGCC
jgi:ArsR family transcriptional regulator